VVTKRVIGSSLSQALIFGLAAGVVASDPEPIQDSGGLEIEWVR
jgi:hypothetical protein